MPWYHASRGSHLDFDGIKANMPGNVTAHPTPYVYLGSLDYIYKQYFRYAPVGTYYVYEVNIIGLLVDSVTLRGEQIRIIGNIPHRHVKFLESFCKLRGVK